MQNDLYSGWQLPNSFRHHLIRAKSRSRMTTAIAFSRQNDAGSRERTIKNWENPEAYI